MAMKPDRAEAVIMACCVLHNLLRMRNPAVTEADRIDPATDEIVPGDWRDDNVMCPIPNPPVTRSTHHGKRQREYLKDYFVSTAGSVSWQGRMGYC